MQYKIPQNVQVEDKIVGPLTLKQLAIMGIGGGITYAVYVTLGREYQFWFSILMASIPGLATLAFTFLKINGIPFHKWIFLTIEYMFIPRKRIYRMGAADVYSATIFSHDEKKKLDEHQETKAETDVEKIKKLGEITKVLDSYGKPPAQI